MDKNFNYMFLARLKSDCEYFLNYGFGSEKVLWAGSIEEQIQTMKDLWRSFASDAKPIWLSLDQIEIYKQRMLKLKEIRLQLKLK